MSEPPRPPDSSRPPLADSYEGLYSRAQNLLRTGDVENAIALYRRLTDRLGRLSDRVLARRPDLRALHRRTRLELAALLTAEARYAEAMEVERVLLETHPDESLVWRRDLAIMRAAKGEVDEGLGELQALAEETPDDPRAWALLGTEARIAGRLADSQRALDRALVESSKDDGETLAEVYLQRFYLLKEMHQLDEAAAAWDEATEQNPSTNVTVRDVYTMFTDTGRYSDALRYVDRDDNELQAGYQRGLIASLTGKPAEALEAWRGVASLDPNGYEYGHDAWVEAVLRLGDPEPALEWLQEALARHGSPRLLILSGIAWAMRDDADLAGLLFQQAITMMRRQRPPKQKLDSADWRLLDTLVADDEAKTALKSHFAVVETLWG